MEEQFNIIEARQISEGSMFSDAKWECSVSMLSENKQLIKFNEGIFNYKPDCLNRCKNIATDWIMLDRPFKFFITPIK